MADKLTPEQKLAVENRGGKLLVSAAAGSGKTKVLVDRLLSYLTDGASPANLDDFLLITYTKAAASELRAKIAAKLTERIAQEPENRHLQKQIQRLFLTKISTVHGFCADILREYAYKLDLSADFRVADENECREIRDDVMSNLLDRAYEQAAENADFRAFVDSQGLGRSDKLVPELIFKVYDASRCHLDPQNWRETCVRHADVSSVGDASQTLWGSYLLEGLRAYLDIQLGIMEQCCQMAEQCEGMEKAAVNLRDTIHQLRFLRDAQSWEEVVARRKIDYGRLTFPRKCMDPELADRIKAARNACKKGLEKKLHHFSDPSSQILSDLSDSLPAVRGIVSLVRQFDSDYSSAKRSRRVLDFGDLEHKMLDLLLGSKRSGPTLAAAEVAARFREIMVDEYQDSNAVQDAIFAALTQKKQNLFMVGDVKQSIYKFRLADPEIFLEKYRTYADCAMAQPGEGRKISLSRNFRSGAEVIEAVNDVFSNCMSTRVGGLDYGEAEALREGIEHELLGSPGVELYALDVREDTYAEEAAFTAQRIRQMLDAGTAVRKNGELQPVKAEDIVILLRSPGSVGFHFQRALEAQGIRCTSGGGTDLLQAPEIATLRSLLQTVYNPRQDIPLISVLASPLFGFSADDLAAFRSLRKHGSVYDALKRSEEEKARNFVEVLKSLREEARVHTLTQLLELCLRLTHMDSIYGAMDAGEERKENLQSFYQLAVDFEAGAHRDLGQFLDHLDAMEEKGLISSGSEASGSVMIMSIHKSKGLEYPVVFLCGLAREFNREDLRAQILCDQQLGLGISVADTENRVRYPSVAKRAISEKMLAESVSEELRVLYVAMTRARDRLIMTYASRNLESDLSDIALRLDMGGKVLLCSDVVCPGEWVLLAAMQRAEAGAFFALGGRPDKLSVSDHPWKIEVVQAPEAQCGTSGEEQTESPPAVVPEAQLRSALSFRYPHLAAAQTPSKQTATGRKGRPKDEEAAQDTRQQRSFRQLRKPSFMGGSLSGKEYGNAIHEAMQFIRFEACGTAAGVEAEVERIIAEGFLTAEQGAAVNRGELIRFFSSDIGKKLAGGVEHLREFKFSILYDASRYGRELAGEKVLLQGVVDCALIEPDGLSIVDFKSDRVSEATLDAAVERYRIQVETYADALSRIYEMPVKAKYLYFFRLDRFVQL